VPDVKLVSIAFQTFYNTSTGHFVQRTSDLEGHRDVNIFKMVNGKLVEVNDALFVVPGCGVLSVPLPAGAVLVSGDNFALIDLLREEDRAGCKIQVLYKNIFSFWIS